MPERAALRRGFLFGPISGYAQLTVCVPDSTNQAKSAPLTQAMEVKEDGKRGKP
jgi:hypothetical protein